MATKMKFPKLFPSIYRTITESRLRKEPNKYIYFAIITISICGIFILSLFTVISAVFLVEQSAKFTRLEMERSKLKSELNLWSSIDEKYPGYKDAYLEMAILEYKLSNFEKAKQLVSKALLLDPNDENAKKLELILEGK